MADIRVRIQKTDGDYLELGDGWIDSLNSLSQSMSDPSTIQYGVLGNSGAINLRDIDNTLRINAENEIIENSTPTEIFVNGNNIQSHIVLDTDYNKNDKILQLQLANNISNLGAKIYRGEKSQNKGLYVYDLLKEFLTTFGYDNTQIDDMLSKEIVYGANNTIGTIKQYAQSIWIPYAFLQQDTFENTINKFCNVLQAQVYNNNNNQLTFTTARPIIFTNQSQSAINIPAYYRINNLTDTILVKNKYDGIDVDVKQIQEKIDYDSLVYSYENNNPSDFQFSDIVYDGAVNTSATAEKSIKIETYYIYKETTLDKSSNNGLEEILNINVNDEPDEDGYYTLDKNSFTLNYNIIKGSLADEDQTIIDMGAGATDENSTFATTEYSQNVDFDYTPENIESKTEKIPTKYTFKVFGLFVNRTITDNSYIKIKDIGQFYSVKYYILSKTIVYDIDILLNTVGFTVVRKISKSSITMNEATNINISFYGSKKTISLNDVDASSPNIANSKNVFTLSSNEMLQTNTKIGEVALIDQIKNNILSDYANGISNATIDIFCGDMYSADGTLQKNWEKGEILEVGDIVYFDDDTYLDGTQRYWRVAGRDFKYQGSPTISLELQEVKIVE